jgi:hypothetical protein
MRAALPDEAALVAEEAESALVDSVHVRLRVLRLICMCKLGKWDIALSLCEQTLALFPMLHSVASLGLMAAKQCAVRRVDHWQKHLDILGKTRLGIANDTTTI